MSDKTEEVKIIGVVGLERTEENTLPADHLWLSNGAQSLLDKEEERANARRHRRTRREKATEHLDRYYRALRLDILRFARLAKLSADMSFYYDYHRTRPTDAFSDGHHLLRQSLGSPIYVNVVLWAEEDAARQYLLSNELARSSPPSEMLVSRDKRVREATIRRLAGASIIADEAYLIALNMGRAELSHYRISND